MIYECQYQTSKRSIRWECTLKVIQPTLPYEFEINANGTCFRVICGTYSFGNYACVPIWDIGCELSYFSDVFWNSERLSRKMSRRDALTIAKGIALAIQSV